MSRIRDSEKRSLAPHEIGPIAKKQKPNPATFSSAHPLSEPPTEKNTGGTDVPSSSDLSACTPDLPADRKSKDNRELIIEQEYQKLKSEIDSMPLPGDHEDDEVECIEDLINREDEIIATDIILARRIVNLKNKRENLSSILKGSGASYNSSPKATSSGNKAACKNYSRFDDEYCADTEDILG